MVDIVDRTSSRHKLTPPLGDLIRLLDVLNGDLSCGDKRLQTLRSEFNAEGDRWSTTNIDGFYAATPARIATGEVEASTMQALRNPGFVRSHATRAAHKGRARLTQLIETTEYPLFTPLAEMELAKLEHSQGRTTDSQVHAIRVRELLANHPEAPYYQQASAIIAGPVAQDRPAELVETQRTQ